MKNRCSEKRYTIQIRGDLTSRGLMFTRRRRARQPEVMRFESISHFYLFPLRHRHPPPPTFIFNSLARPSFETFLYLLSRVRTHNSYPFPTETKNVYSGELFFHQKIYRGKMKNFHLVFHQRKVIWNFDECTKALRVVIKFMFIIE